MENEKKVGIIIQARTTSTRLPRKILLKAGGKTVLQHGLDRLSWSGLPVYVATTINKTDDEIVELCESIGVPCYRGSEGDVLSRYYECAKKFGLDVVVRATSDNPLVDGNLVKEGVRKYLRLPENSYVSNCLEDPYPHGFNFEIFSFNALEHAHTRAKEPFEREHVTPFIFNVEKNKGVALSSITYQREHSHIRLTVDEPDDWHLIKILMNEYRAYEKNCEDIIDLLERNPHLAKINAHVRQIKI